MKSILIDNSIKDEYHSQRNNAIVPFASCNTTSMVMFLKYNHLFDKIKWPLGIQPEDYLSQELRANELPLVKKYAPWFIDKATGKSIYPAQQIHAVLSGFINELMGGDYIGFTTKMPMDEINLRLHRGQSLVINGRWKLGPGEDNRSISHINVLCGMREEEGYGISHYLIDDPYGDPNSFFKSHKGNNVEILYDEFIKRVSARGHYMKWAHYVKENK